MNELQELKTLLRDLLSAIEQVVASGEELSDDLQAQLAQTLQVLFERIQSLSEEPVETLPEKIPPDTSGIESGMPSSNIEGFSYDEKTNRMLVRFLGEHPNRNGPVYAYEGVPKVIFDLFRHGSVPARTDGRNKWGRWWKGKVPSLGASLYTLIKTQSYPYQRLT